MPVGIDAQLPIFLSLFSLTQIVNSLHNSLFYVSLFNSYTLLIYALLYALLLFVYYHFF